MVVNNGTVEHFKVDKKNLNELWELWFHSEDTNLKGLQTVDPGRLNKNKKKAIFF